MNRRSGSDIEPHLRLLPSPLSAKQGPKEAGEPVRLLPGSQKQRMDAAVRRRAHPLPRPLKGKEVQAAVEGAVRPWSSPRRKKKEVGVEQLLLLLFLKKKIGITFCRWQGLGEGRVIYCNDYKEGRVVFGKGKRLHRLKKRRNKSTSD